MTVCSQRSAVQQPTSPARRTVGSVKSLLCVIHCRCKLQPRSVGARGKNDGLFSDERHAACIFCRKDDDEIGQECVMHDPLSLLVTTLVSWGAREEGWSALREASCSQHRPLRGL